MVVTAITVSGSVACLIPRKKPMIMMDNNVSIWIPQPRKVRQLSGMTSLKMCFDLLQSFPFRFRQKHGRCNEVDYGAARKPEKHSRVAILADRRQEYCSNGG